MVARLRYWLIRVAAVLAVVLVTVLAVRAYDAWRSPPLSLWHTEVPDELDADAIDAADWATWLAAESRVMDEVRTRVAAKLPAADRIPANRYFDASPMYAGRFATDWNRSFVLTPAGAPRGAAVLLHGLTDSPYSLRHIGAYYRQQGFVVVSIRMPGHGTVPAGLTDARWEDWLAATRLAVRQARTLVSGDAPLHIVGYSNGGALALKYTVDAIRDDRLHEPDQLVLVSPMVGITSLARFAGVLGWPAAFPGFAKAAWLETLPEYNPFKYNSFPVNAARQSSQLVRRMQGDVFELADTAGLGDFPRVLVFQSVVDATVSTAAVSSYLLQMLPTGRGELVLFDRNRAATAGPLVRPESVAVLGQLTSMLGRGYDMTVITSGAAADAMEVHRYAPGHVHPVISPLAAVYPPEMYSLSHVALPFPLDDPVYGRQPRVDENFGIHLGTVAVRGERGVLVVSVDALMRAMSNPFFDYQLQRIGETLAR